MNEIFSFRKELNIKKIIIVIFIIILILGVIIWKAFSPSKKNNSVQEKISSTETNFYSKNKEISLKVSNSYDFTQITPNSNYILELRNKHNLNIFITKENLLPNITLSDLVEADHLTFLMFLKLIEVKKKLIHIVYIISMLILKQHFICKQYGLNIIANTIL